MNPLLAYGLTTAGSGIANKLFGGESEQDKLLKWLKSQIAKPDVAFGIPQGERKILSNRFKRNRLKSAGTDISRGTASLARRGVTDPNSLTRLNTSMGNQAAEDVNDFDSDLLLEHLRKGRAKKAQYEGAYANVAGGMGGDNTGDISEIAQNLMTYFLNQNKKPGNKTGFTSSGFMPGLR